MPLFFRYQGSRGGRQAEAFHLPPISRNRRREKKKKKKWNRFGNSAEAHLDFCGLGQQKCGCWGRRFLGRCPKAQLWRHPTSRSRDHSTTRSLAVGSGAGAMSDAKAGGSRSPRCPATAPNRSNRILREAASRARFGRNTHLGSAGLDVGWPRDGQNLALPHFTAPTPATPRTAPIDHGTSEGAHTGK